ncbi:MAG: helix-turn-helix transcriptional regulator [Pseudoruegeria sp.]
MAQKLGAQALNVAAFSKDEKRIKWVNSSMRSDWLEEYTAQNLAPVDPFIDAALKNVPEISTRTGCVKEKNAATYELNHRLRAAGYYHLRSYLAPTGSAENRITVLCSEDPDFENVSPETMQLRRQIGNLISLNISAPVDEGGTDFLTPLNLSKLTEREEDILCFLASGYRNDAIAYRLGLAEVTVRAHILSARKKLGAPTRENAIAIAMRDGHIRI